MKTGMKSLGLNIIIMKKINLLVIITLLAACGKRGKEIKQPVILDDVIAVKTEQVLNGNSKEPIVASGLIASLSEARLSFKTGGIIEKIYVKEGLNVSKGQLLATLNLTEISANVQQAQESVNKSERDLKRITNLYADSVSTLEQVQNLTTALSVAKQNLQIAQYNRSYSTIHAPISGTIVKKIMNEGELVGPGNPVFFITATASADWILKAGVTDFNWAKLKIGDQAEISLGAFPDQIFQAKISNLSQVPDPNSGLYQAELKINTLGKKMASGLFGEAKIYQSFTENKTSVSINALIEGNNNNAFVYTIGADLKAKKIAVLVDYIANNRAFLKYLPDSIKSVITDGSAYLVDGAKVKLVK
jgi:membrane fusion protein, multidrug efflux system